MLIYLGMLQFSKASGRIKDMILSLPVATEEEDAEEAAALKDEKDAANGKFQSNQDAIFSDQTGEGPTKEECDPFGLDALIANSPKKDEKAKEKKGREDEEDTKRFRKLQREALINCLEIAAKRYKTPWFVLALLASEFLSRISSYSLCVC